MLQVILVFVGGAFGSAARHGVNMAAARWIGIDFPWGTMIVNVVGSFLMGALTAWFAFRSDPFWSQQIKLLATTGFLGGFTTFSAFSLDSALMWEKNAFGPFAIYVIGSVLISLIALFLGLWLVRSLA